MQDRAPCDIAHSRRTLSVSYASKDDPVGQELHDLRHTAASLMLNQGVNPRVVMEILGHSQVSVTLNTYSHVSTTVTRDAVDGMSAVLWEPDSRRSDEP